MAIVLLPTVGLAQSKPDAVLPDGNDRNLPPEIGERLAAQGLTDATSSRLPTWWAPKTR
jgi:hypothetical protein